MPGRVTAWSTLPCCLSSVLLPHPMSNNSLASSVLQPSQRRLWIQPGGKYQSMYMRAWVSSLILENKNHTISNNVLKTQCAPVLFLSQLPSWLNICQTLVPFLGGQLQPFFLFSLPPSISPSLPLFLPLSSYITLLVCSRIFTAHCTNKVLTL